jgi:hypothetical protein
MTPTTAPPRSPPSNGAVADLATLAATIRRALYNRQATRPIEIGDFCYLGSEVRLAPGATLGDWSLWDLAPAAAIVLYWPIQEWLIHVYILHSRPVTLFGRTFDPPVPRKHREHHRAPWEIDLLFIPMHSFIYTVPLLVLLWFVATPSTPLALTGIVAHLALTLHYSGSLLGAPAPAGLDILSRLWRNHRLRHFGQTAGSVSRAQRHRLLRTAGGETLRRRGHAGRWRG